jgi:hypothetical protein
MRRGTRLSLLATAFAMALAFAPERHQALAAVGVADDEVVVTGCVVKGNNGGYALTNVVPGSIDVASRTTATAQPAPSDVAAGASRVVYWLEDFEEQSGDVEDYEGRRVEIRGELEGDVEKGELEIERDGEWVKIKLEKDGDKDIETRMPLALFLAGDSPVGTTGELKEGDNIELNLNVRRLDVKDVKVVTGTCR